ncbi:Cutinase transcription factor 1 beta [Cyphellophora attinorum]|uniref:Cutinase transcription factor 1 beta n=1 Tax=Cyphellophora attinorum TaxID=1664694 RepID=A0A0N0NJ95_9EURO|nr:Cutinase transcription factor 1 beta [Phialophora attinorum]KPI36359.1 Cutinase transcription factor 1 beta [Phialophora attinorum]
MTDHRYPGPKIGAGWVSMIEPEVGYESAFNRWYSDDHFYAGGMCLPGIFAGRRWVATKELRALRYSDDQELRDFGCYLHTNLFSSHQLDDVNNALSTTLQHLGKEGRMYPTEIPRRHLYTAICPYSTVVYREGNDDGPHDVHALDYPFQGLVLEIIDAESNDERPDLLKWLTEHFILAKLKQSSALMCLVFVHADLPDIIKSPRLPAKYPTGDSRVVLLWFLESDPRSCWRRDFADHNEAIDGSGKGRLILTAPFIPTIPGTNRTRRPRLPEHSESPSTTSLEPDLEDSLTTAEQAGFVANVVANPTETCKPFFIGTSGYGDLLRTITPAKQVHFSVPVEMENSLDPEDLAYLQIKGCFSIPEHCEVLLKAYFDFVHPLFPILDGTGFCREYNEGGSEKTNLLLLWSMLSVAASYVPAYARRSIKEQFVSRARLLFHLAPENNKMVVIQSALLISFWFTEAQDIKQSWFWTGIAFSVAQSCGLHLDDTSCSTGERGVRRNLWRACMLRDVWLSYTMGRPLRLNVDDGNIPDDFTTKDAVQSMAIPTANDQQYTPEESTSLQNLWRKLIQVSSLLREFLSSNTTKTDAVKIMRKMRHCTSTVSDNTSLLITIADRHFQLYLNAALIAVYRRADRYEDARTAAAAVTSIMRLFMADSTIQYVAAPTIPLVVPSILIYLEELKRPVTLTETAKTSNVVQEYKAFLEAIEENYPAASILKRLIVAAADQISRLRLARGPNPAGGNLKQSYDFSSGNSTDTRSESPSLPRGHWTADHNADIALDFTSGERSQDFADVNWGASTWMQQLHRLTNDGWDWTGTAGGLMAPTGLYSTQIDLTENAR